MLGEYSLTSVVVYSVILAVNESVNTMAEDGGPTAQGWNSTHWQQAEWDAGDCG